MVFKKDSLQLDALGIQKMASGHLCLNLSENVQWEDFSAYAGVLLKAINGRKVDAVESPEMKIWNLSVDGQAIRLVQEDYPSMVSLESSSDEGDALLRRLHVILLNPT